MLRETDKERTERINSIKEEVQSLMDDKEARFFDLQALIRGGGFETTKTRALGYIGLMLMQLIEKSGDE